MTKFIPYRGETPEKSRPTDAAYDLRAAHTRTILPGNRLLVETGTQIALPDNHVGLVCSRSGMALKHGVIVLNAPGVIDPDYIGDVSVILQNFGEQSYTVEKGDRIAQLLIVETAHVGFALASAGLTSLMRHNDGFGSSGVA